MQNHVCDNRTGDAYGGIEPWSKSLRSGTLRHTRQAARALTDGGMSDDSRHSSPAARKRPYQPSDTQDRSKRAKVGLGNCVDDKLRVGCPYYINDPASHQGKMSCRGLGFAEIAKLKDHLKSVHHISKDMLKKLNFKAKEFRTLSSLEEKWKLVFKILFPDVAKDKIPSPLNLEILNPLVDLTRLKSLLEDRLLSRFGLDLAIHVPEFVTEFGDIFAQSVKAMKGLPSRDSRYTSEAAESVCSYRSLSLLNGLLCTSTQSSSVAGSFRQESTAPSSHGSTSGFDRFTPPNEEDEAAGGCGMHILKRGLCVEPEDEEELDTKPAITPSERSCSPSISYEPRLKAEPQSPSVWNFDEAEADQPSQPPSQSTPLEPAVDPFFGAEHRTSPDSCLGRNSTASTQEHRDELEAAESFQSNGTSHVTASVRDLTPISQFFEGTTFFDQPIGQEWLRDWSFESSQ